MSSGRLLMLMKRPVATPLVGVPSLCAFKQWLRGTPTRGRACELVLAAGVWLPGRPQGSPLPYAKGRECTVHVQGRGAPCVRSGNNSQALPTRGVATDFCYGVACEELEFNFHVPFSLTNVARVG